MTEPVTEADDEGKDVAWSFEGKREAAAQAEARVRELEAWLGQTYAEQRQRGLTPLAIAELCDEFLDRSGALLGRVRRPYRAALAPPTEPDHE